MIKGKQFNNAIQKVIEERGAKIVISCDYYKEWEIETKYGKLSITLYPPKKRPELFSVFTRFKEPEKAKEHTDCNPYSGKWNFHIIDMKEGIKIFTNSLDNVMYSYVITTRHTSKKTIREVYKCDSPTSLGHMTETLKNNPKRYSSITISRKEPELVKKENYVTIFNDVELVV